MPTPKEEKIANIIIYNFNENIEPICLLAMNTGHSQSLNVLQVHITTCIDEINHQNTLNNEIYDLDKIKILVLNKREKATNVDENTRNHFNIFVNSVINTMRKDITPAYNLNNTTIKTNDAQYYL